MVPSLSPGRGTLTKNEYLNLNKAAGNQGFKWKQKKTAGLHNKN